MMASSSAPARVDNYAAEGDVRTLAEAHKIKKDGPRHAAAKAHAKTQLEAMRAISQPMDGPTIEGKEVGKPDAEDRAEMKKMKKRGK